MNNSKDGRNIITNAKRILAKRHETGGGVENDKKPQLLVKLYNQLSKAKNLVSLDWGYDEDEGHYLIYKSGLESESDYHKGELEEYDFYLSDGNKIESVYALSGNSNELKSIEEALYISRANEDIKMATGGGVASLAPNLLMELWFAVWERKKDDYSEIGEKLDKEGVSFTIQNLVSEDAQKTRSRKAIDTLEVKDRISKIMSKNMMSKGGGVGKKVFNQMSGVGSSKYVVNFHDGKKTHKDGSPFFDIEIFKNKVSLNKFIDKLQEEGYTQGYANGGNITDGVVGQEIIFDYLGEEKTGVIREVTNAGDYVVNTDDGRTVLAQVDRDVIELRGMRKKAVPETPRKLFGFFKDGGGVDDYTKHLGNVKVKFANPKYNYETSVSGDITEEEAREYFVGKVFDRGVYPKENMQKVIDIEFSEKGTYATGGNIESYVVVSKAPDGYLVVMSKPTSKTDAQKLAKLTTPPRGEVISVMTTESVRSSKKVLGREYLADGGKMAFGGMVNDLSEGTIDRMEGLHPLAEMDTFLYHADLIIEDMENEGYEKDEIISFLAYKMVERSRMQDSTQMATGGNVESGAAHLYITLDNGDIKVYHGDDRKTVLLDKPQVSKGSWTKLWNCLRGL